MDRKIFFYPERCMLCLSCVLACEMQSIGVSDARAIPRNKKPKRRLSVAFARGTPWAWKCQHCDSAPCIEACVSGSLVRDEEGTRILHHPETCVGCGSCLLACPFEALDYDEEEGRVAKCNLCYEEEAPPCVRACQSKALVQQGQDLFARGKKKNFAQELRWVREAE